MTEADSAIVLGVQVRAGLHSLPGEAPGKKPFLPALRGWRAHHANVTPPSSLCLPLCPLLFL